MSDNYIGYFSQERHKPILLIDGELYLQDVSDKAYLKNFYMKIKEPKKITVIKNSDHCSNVFEHKGKIFYNKIVVNDIVKEIDLFLSEE